MAPELELCGSRREESAFQWSLRSKQALLSRECTFQGQSGKCQGGAAWPEQGSPWALEQSMAERWWKVLD